MASKNTNYKRNLERYKKFLEGTSVGQELGYQFLEHPSTAKKKADLVYEIMDGSYRNQSGTGGARTFRGKRVDTYEGRISAVVDLLGLDNSRYFTSLEKLISTNVYLNTTKSKNVANEGALRSEVVGNYVRGLKEGAIKVEKKLEPKVQDLTKKLNVSDGLLTIVTKQRDELDSIQRSRSDEIKTLEEKNKKQGDELTQAYRTALDLCLEARGHRFWRNTLAAGLAASLAVGTFMFGGCSGNKNDSKTQSYNPVTSVKLVSRVKSSFPNSVLYPKLASSKNSLCYKGVKKSHSDLDGGVTPEQLRKFYDDNPTISPDYSEKEQKTVYVEKKSQVVEQKVVDAQIKPVGTNGLYRMHVDFRNLQSRDSDGDSLDDKVSMNPSYTGRALKNNFSDLGSQVVDGKNLGYTEGKTSSRLKNLGRALVSPVDSVLGVVSGGRLGLHEDTKKSRSEDNVLLGSIRSVYDGVQSISRGVVDGADLVLGGLTDKLVYDVVGGSAKTWVNSTVDLGNFAFAVPLDATQRFENWAFKNKGKISMETYELASTIMRFGGNVVLHEAPFDGKYVEVISEDGKKVLINKGETGATLESLMAVLLDAGVLSSHKSGGNDGNSDGGSWSWNSSGSPGGDVGSFGSSGSGGGI